MKNIRELRANLENFKKSRGTDTRTYAKVQNGLKELELEFESQEKELALHREKSDSYLRDSLLLKEEKEALLARVTRLSKEKSELETRLEVMQRKRPALSSANLIGTFKTSLSEMNRGLKKAPERTNYHVSSMNVKLRANLALDGTELKFQMPEADDIIPPENLSEIEFTLRELPEKAGPAGYREVPDLCGLSLKAAGARLQEAGFRVGEVLEKDVKEGGEGIPQGTVLSQLPSAHALATAKAPVDLVISGRSSAKVPNLLGLELESAMEVLEKSGLKTGPIKKQASDVKPGIIIAQSLRPGEEVKAGAGIGLVVSVKRFTSTVKEIEKERGAGNLQENVREEKRKAGEATQKTRPGPLKKPAVISRAEKPSGEKPSGEKPAGKSRKIVPKLSGLPLKKALEALEREGIKAGKITEINSRATPETVIEQSPRAGAIANPKIPVDLIVSKGSLRSVKASGSRQKTVFRSGRLS